MGTFEFSVVSANTHFVGKIDLLSAILYDMHSGVNIIVHLLVAAKKHFRICSSKTRNNELSPKSNVRRGV
jgi:hypothetical protein